MGVLDFSPQWPPWTAAASGCVCGGALAGGSLPGAGEGLVHAPLPAAELVLSDQPFLGATTYTFGLTEAEELDSVELMPRKKRVRRGESFCICGVSTHSSSPSHLQTRSDNPRRDDLWSLGINDIVHFHKDFDNAFMWEVKLSLTAKLTLSCQKARASSGTKRLSFSQ